MLRALELPGLRQQLDKDGLAYVLGIVGAFQIGVAQAEDGVGIGLDQVFRPLCLVHGINSFGARSS